MYEPLWPSIPTSVTPVVYTVPAGLACVPSDVVENFNGWALFEESLWSKRYVFPDFNTIESCCIPLIKYLPWLAVTVKTVAKSDKVPLELFNVISESSKLSVGSLDVNVKSISVSELEEPLFTVVDVIVIVGRKLLIVASPLKELICPISVLPA